MVIAAAELLATTSHDRSETRFAYDVDFEMRFDNREYYRSSFSRSMTIFGARLTPSFGIAVNKGDNTHKVMMGIDVMKDFGASPVPSHIAGSGSEETALAQNNLKLFRELTLFYNLKAHTSESSVEVYAGIFPRNRMEGFYSDAFFSDSLKYYDNNLEGLLVKIRRSASYFEVGCDWAGQYGNARRERFMVFSAGEMKPLPYITFGYSAYMYHFASSSQVKGVVDNVLINPYINLDLASVVPAQRLMIGLGWLQSAQHDRVNVGRYIFPGGGELRAEVKKWDLGLRNDLFYGADMMPYYNSPDAGGYKYGNRLYPGDPFFRVHDDGTSGPGIYDRLEMYYEPRVCGFLDLRISAIFHFNKGYSGCRQMVSLHFDLQNINKRRR